jgi:protein-arginine kinase activator protein McsA
MAKGELKKCIDCGKEFESTYQFTDMCNECFDIMVEELEPIERWSENLIN